MGKPAKVPRTPRSTPALRYLRFLMFGIALALPILSLVVLGSLWLWQNGYLLYWSAAAFGTTAIAFSAERWVLREAFQNRPIVVPAVDTTMPEQTAREAAAWRAVVALSESVDPQTIDSRDAFLDLGKKTIDVVARHMHPDHKDPFYRFTLPELLALTAKVSAKLGPFVRENIPLGDRLTVGQILVIYRWRGVLNVADKAYDIWRIIRLMNPATAITQELREKLTRQLYDWGRNEAARRLNNAYVREIGRAAIDLHSGRLRHTGQTDEFEESNSRTATLSPVDRTANEHAADVESAPNPAGRPKTRGARSLFRQIGNAAKLIFRRSDDDPAR